MYKFILSLVITISLVGCSPAHKSPTSDIFDNDLSQNGLLLEVSKEGKLLNIHSIELSINAEQREKFNLSMQWIATESEVSFGTLVGKPAFDIVQLANCLKTVGNKTSDCI